MTSSQTSPLLSCLFLHSSNKLFGNYPPHEHISLIKKVFEKCNPWVYFRVLRFLISVATCIQTMVSFTELLQYCTEWLLSNSFRPWQVQSVIENRRSWSQNFRNIPEKHSRWSTTNCRLSTCNFTKAALRIFQIFSKQLIVRQLWATAIIYKLSYFW